MNNTTFRRITSTHSISNLSPNPDKPEPYRFEKLSCHSFFGNFFYHRLSGHRKKFSVFFIRNSTVNWLQHGRCSLERLRGGAKFNYNEGTPAFKTRTRTAYFSNSSLTASPTFARAYGFFMYFPAPNSWARSISFCQAPVLVETHSSLSSRQGPDCLLPI